MFNALSVVYETLPLLHIISAEMYVEERDWWFIAKFVGRNRFNHDNSVICTRAKEVGV